MKMATGGGGKLGGRVWEKTNKIGGHLESDMKM